MNYLKIYSLRVFCSRAVRRQATTAPPWAGCKRATQVISSSDNVAGQSQLADDRVSPARAGGYGIRDEAGGVAAAGQT